MVAMVSHFKASLGRIDGVIHAAGIAGNGLVQLKSRQMAEEVFLPKIQGTYNLAAALQGLSLDFVALMSSIASIIGEKGQVDYCAANACLDAFALTRFFPAKLVTSINWNSWREIGMAAETLRPSDINYFNRGNDISPQEGQQLFLQIMEQRISNAIISNFPPEYCTSMLLIANEKAKVTQIKVTREELSIASDYQKPANQIEEKLALLWQDNLGIDAVGRKDDFFALGGHSLKALSLIEKINNTFNASISIQHLYKAPSIEQLSQLINNTAKNELDIIVPLKTIHTDFPPFFFCHPASGLINCFHEINSQWQMPISLYGLQDPSISAGLMLYESITEMAHAYLSAIKQIQPQGPYYLLGYSFGGTVLYEVAHLLLQQGESIGLLALIESWSIFSNLQYNEHHFKEVFQSAHQGLSSHLVDLAWKRMQLLLNHTPAKINQEMVLFKATQLFDEYQSINHPMNGWTMFNSGQIDCHMIEANHDTIVNRNNSLIISNILQERIYNRVKAQDRKKL